MLDHVQAQPLKFILVGVEKCSEIRSCEDAVERWDSSTRLCITAVILWAGVTNPDLARSLVSLLSWSLQGTHIISCLLLACGGTSYRGKLMAQCWKIREAMELNRS